jgi:hypothetical protein
MLTSVGSAPVGTDLDIVSKLLDFHLQRLEQADQQQWDLKKALGQAHKKRYLFKSATSLMSNCCLCSKKGSCIGHTP